MAEAMPRLTLALPDSFSVLSYQKIVIPKRSEESAFAVPRVQGRFLSDHSGFLAR